MKEDYCRIRKDKGRENLLVFAMLPSILKQKKIFKAVPRKTASSRLVIRQPDQNIDIE